MVFTVNACVFGLMFVQCLLPTAVDSHFYQPVTPQRKTKLKRPCLSCVKCMPHVPRNRYKPPRGGLKIDKDKCPEKGCQEYSHLQQILYIYSFAPNNASCFTECRTCIKQIKRACPKLKPLNEHALILTFKNIFGRDNTLTMKKQKDRCCKTIYEEEEPFVVPDLETFPEPWYPVYIAYSDNSELQYMYQYYKRVETCKGYPDTECEITYHEGNMLMTSLSPDPALGHTVVLLDYALNQGMNSANIQFMLVPDVVSFCMCHNLGTKP